MILEILTHSVLKPINKYQQIKKFIRIQDWTSKRSSPKSFGIGLPSPIRQYTIRFGH